MELSTKEILSLLIADLPLRLDLSECDEAIRARLREHYAAFMVPALSTRSPAPLIRLHVEPGPEFIPFQFGGAWCIRTTRREGRIEFESHLEQGWFDAARGEGEITLRPRGDPENFMRVLYAWFCLENHALLVHASGVIRQGKGYTFFGASGSGKTTIAQLSLEHKVLSDDLVILKKEGTSFRAYGVPFRGDMIESPRTNASAPLAGLFTLVKDTTHYWEPMSPVQAVARLTACVPFVMRQPDHAQQVMQIATELVRCVPVRALHFRRDSGFWEAVDG